MVELSMQPTITPIKVRNAHVLRMDFAACLFKAQEMAKWGSMLKREKRATNRVLHK